MPADQIDLMMKSGLEMETLIWTGSLPVKDDKNVANAKGKYLETYSAIRAKHVS